RPLPAAAMAELIRDQRPKVLESIARNPKTPADALRKLAASSTQTEYLVLAIANNRSAPPDVVARIAKYGDRFARSFLAKRADLSPEVLTSLAQDGDLGVRALVAGNPVTPAAE